MEKENEKLAYVDDLRSANEIALNRTCFREYKMLSFHIFGLQFARKERRK